MADSSSVNTAIGTSAETGVQSASSDAGSVTSMTIGDRIKAAQHLANNEAAAANRPFFGVRLQKIKPPGCGT